VISEKLPISQALRKPHAAHGEARQRTDQHGQHHRCYAQIDAVAELVPEALEIRLLSSQIAWKLSRLGSLGQMVPVNSSPSR
jgi:hypothetical protein